MLDHRTFGRSCRKGIVLALIAAAGLLGPTAAAMAGAVPGRRAPAWWPWDPFDAPTADSAVSADSSTDVWAVGWSSGFGLVQHWDGTAWTHVHASRPPNAYTMGFNAVSAVAANDVWVVGDFYTSKSKGHHPLLEHWDGRSFSIVKVDLGKGDITLQGISAVSADNIWVVGRVDKAGLVLHWNGTDWTSTRLQAGTFTDLSAVSAQSTKDVWAVGFYVTSSTGLPQLPVAEHWNGQGWTQVPTPALQGSYGYLVGIDAVSATDVWAVGHTGDIADQRSLVEHWDGQQWAVVSISHPGQMDYLTGVAADDSGTVWAVGVAVTAANSSTLIQRWDGSSWHRVTSPEPIRDTSRCANALNAAIVISPDDAWAVGYASKRQWPKSDALHLHWDGASWQQQ